MPTCDLSATARNAKKRLIRADAAPIAILRDGNAAPRATTEGSTSDQLRARHDPRAHQVGPRRSAVEYGLLAALIAVVIIGGVTLVGSNLSATFTKVSTKVSPSP